MDKRSLVHPKGQSAHIKVSALYYSHEKLTTARGCTINDSRCTCCDKDHPETMDYLLWNRPQSQKVRSFVQD